MVIKKENNPKIKPFENSSFWNLLKVPPKTNLKILSWNYFSGFQLLLMVVNTLEELTGMR